jgi:valyl-tRNA synthetase
MAPLAAPAIAAVESGQVRFVPERWTKVFLDWLGNIRDWCVSRQLWWGHRIPAWHCQGCPEIVVAEEPPASCPRCGGGLRQDEDVLDTWFSSGLWPFSTLGWPQPTDDLRTFYPTTLLVTGYDIIFFWVARMVMLGLEFTGQVPFRTVCIHGLVRDELGRKMSKTRGNVVDPMELVERHGVDPLRFGLASMTTQGQDFSLAEERFESAHAFLNKLWNASKLVLMNTPESLRPKPLAGLELGPVDRWILTRLEETAAEVTALYDDVELAPVARSLYAFTWGELCDWYLELAKLDLYGEDPARKEATLQVLHAVLRDVLKLLHPLVPFVTEALWESLPGATGSISVAPWPAGHGLRASELEMRQVADLLELVRSLRSMRSDLGLSPSEKARAAVRADEPDLARLRRFEPAIRRLATLEALDWLPPDAPRVTQALYATFGPFEAYLRVPSPELLAREVARLTKDIDKHEAQRERLARKLENPGFLAKAAPEVVAKDRAALAETVEALERLKRRRERLEGRG